MAAAESRASEVPLAPSFPAGRQALRVLFCTHNYFPAAAGGAERQAQLQAEALTARGHEVTVVCRRTGSFATERINGVNVIRLRAVDLPFLRALTHMVALYAFVLRRGRRFDLVHVHLASVQAEVVVRAARLLRRPVYVKVACGGSVGDVRRHPFIGRVTRHLGLRRAARVQALSSEIEGELISVGVDPRRILRIPNGIRLRASTRDGNLQRAARRDLALPETGKVVLYAGRFATYKGVPELLEAWRGADRPPATLVMVGTADTHYAVDVPVGIPGVEVRGWSNDLSSYFAAADVFVHPAHADGMPNALLEAMSFGLPVAAAETPATRPLVIDGQNGVMFRAGDARSLASGVARLVSDEELMSGAEVVALQTAKAYAIDDVIERIEQAYYAILNEVDG